MDSLPLVMLMHYIHSCTIEGLSTNIHAQSFRNSERLLRNICLLHPTYAGQLTSSTGSLAQTISTFVFQEQVFELT
jgi:hypothetical protein